MSPTTEQPKEDEKEPLSALLRQENFFDSGESPENKNLRSKTLAGGTTLYKSFTIPVSYQKSLLAEEIKQTQEERKPKVEEDDELSEGEEARLLK